MNVKLTRNSCRFGLGVITLLALLWLPANAFTDELMYLQLRIDESDVPGDSQDETLGRGDDIVVYSFGHEINAPIDPSGERTGARQHGTLKIVKAVNNSSPLLYAALTDNLPVEAVLRFFRTHRSGLEENYFTIELLGAKIVNIRTAASADPEILDKEIVSFVYETISWTYVVNGLTHTDTWGDVPQS